MKNIFKNTLCAFVTLCLCATVNAQTIYRCNNDPNVTLSPNMFRTLQAAHDAASAGDIIYVEPSYNSATYGSLTCTKTLRIIGNGYEHTPNTSVTQPWQKISSVVGAITIQKTAQNTKIEGLEVLYFTIEAPNVIVNRCIITQENPYSIRFHRRSTGENGSGTIIKNCKFNSNGVIVYEGYSSYSAVTCNYTPFQVENITITNNLFRFGFSTSAANTLQTGGGTCANPIPPITVPTAKSLTVTNNTSANNSTISLLSCQSCTVQNNICNSTQNLGNNISNPGTVASNNVCDVVCGYGSNNVENVIWTSLFIVSNPNYTNPDEDFRLSPTSPAIGVGLGGIDAGAFGGSDPYRISGLAPIPQITSYSKNASSGVYTTTTPMTVTISVRGNN